MLVLASSVTAQEPSLETILKRTAAYVAELNTKLSGIVAEEVYIQEIKHAGGRSGAATPFVNRVELRSDFLLVRPPGVERFVEFRDVFEVNSRPVRDRQDRLVKLFLDETDSDRVRAIVEESARYNIGNIPRNVNTPMLPLTFLQASYQSRFRFKRSGGNVPELSALVLSGRGGPAVFRSTTEVWAIEF